MKDFSRQSKVVEFRIGPDVFRGKPFLAAQTMIDFTVKMESLDGESTSQKDGFDSMMEALRLVLMPDSYKRFRDRMVDPYSGDGSAYEPGSEPIETDQMVEIAEWLLGEYGMRPTAVPSESSDGPPDPEPGTSLTGSTSGEVSTSVTSPSIAS